MDDFISREATIKRIKEVYCVGCNSYHGVRCRSCGTGDAIDIIEDAPAAERRMIMAKRTDRRQTKCNGKDAIIERECSEKQTSHHQ